MEILYYVGDKVVPGGREGLGCKLRQDVRHYQVVERVANSRKLAWRIYVTVLLHALSGVTNRFSLADGSAKSH